MYASILNQSNTLVADGAGTIATYADTEWFDWTFSTPGTYYLVMESNGDEPPGNPTYSVSYKVVSAGSPSPGSSGPNPPRVSPSTSQAPLVRSLRVASKQHGRTVRALLSLGQRGSVRATLTMRGSRRSIIGVTEGSLGPGSHKLSLRMPASYRKAMTYGLSLALTVSVRGASGVNRTFTPHVFLLR